VPSAEDWELVLYMDPLVHAAASAVLPLYQDPTEYESLDNLYRSLRSHIRYSSCQV